jgi:hypothetical protein
LFGRREPFSALFPVLSAPSDSPDLAAVAPFLLPEPFLKSVAYHPLPRNWNPAAVSCFEKVSAWHCGQLVNGASDTFCSTSRLWPQDEHL